MFKYFVLLLVTSLSINLYAQDTLVGAWQVQGVLQDTDKTPYQGDLKITQEGKNYFVHGQYAFTNDPSKVIATLEKVPARFDGDMFYFEFLASNGLIYHFNPNVRFIVPPKDPKVLAKLFYFDASIGWSTPGLIGHIQAENYPEIRLKEAWRKKTSTAKAPKSSPKKSVAPNQDLIGSWQVDGELNDSKKTKYQGNIKIVFDKDFYATGSLRIAQHVIASWENAPVTFKNRKLHFSIKMSGDLVYVFYPENVFIAPPAPFEIKYDLMFYKLREGGKRVPKVGGKWTCEDETISGKEFWSQTSK